MGCIAWSLHLDRCVWLCRFVGQGRVFSNIGSLCNLGFVLSCLKSIGALVRSFIKHRGRCRCRLLGLFRRESVVRPGDLRLAGLLLLRCTDGLWYRRRLLALYLGYRTVAQERFGIFVVDLSIGQAQTREELFVPPRMLCFCLSCPALLHNLLQRAAIQLDTRCRSAWLRLDADRTGRFLDQVTGAWFITGMVRHRCRRAGRRRHRRWCSTAGRGVGAPRRAFKWFLELLEERVDVGIRNRRSLREQL